MFLSKSGQNPNNTKCNLGAVTQVTMEGGKVGLFVKMNKNLITVLIIAFMAVKNPVTGLLSIQQAIAAESKQKAIALSEADIASNIESLYGTEEVVTVEERAQIQLVAYQTALEEQKIKEKQAEEEKLAKENIERTSKLLAAGLKTTYVNNYVKAQNIYGVPWEIIAAVHFVETGQRGDTTIASYAGAQGPMQFMPATWRAYAQDGNGDGQSYIGSVDDAIFTGAKYLAANGGSRGQVTNALFHYNHSMAYVNKVLGVARSIGYNK